MTGLAFALSTQWLCSMRHFDVSLGFTRTSTLGLAYLHLLRTRTVHGSFDPSLRVPLSFAMNYGQNKQAERQDVGIYVAASERMSTSSY